MKIKTIISRLNYPATFDAEVNEAQEEGWRLVKREVLLGTPGDADSTRLLYAELVQLDPEPEAPAEPETLDPIEALHVVKEFCHTVPKCVDCPLVEWCSQLQKGGDPTDWVIPEEAEA
jgi:hypothetical protein